MIDNLARAKTHKRYHQKHKEKINLQRKINYSSKKLKQLRKQLRELK